MRMLDDDGDDGDACEGRWTDRTSTRGVRGWCGAARDDRIGPTTRDAEDSVAKRGAGGAAGGGWC